MNEQFKENKTGTNHFIGGIGAVYIPVSDFWKSKKWYEEVLDLRWGGHCFRLYDPDGNKIDIWNTDYQHETDPHWEEEK